jgi:hypothetical protein
MSEALGAKGPEKRVSGRAGVVNPNEVGNMMQSLLNDAQQGGEAMPRWEQVHCNSGGMVPMFTG